MWAGQGRGTDTHLRTIHDRNDEGEHEKGHGPGDVAVEVSQFTVRKWRKQSGGSEAERRVIEIAHGVGQPAHLQYLVSVLNVGLL